MTRRSSLSWQAVLALVVCSALVGFVVPAAASSVLRQVHQSSAVVKIVAPPHALHSDDTFAPAASGPAPEQGAPKLRPLTPAQLARDHPLLTVKPRHVPHLSTPHGVAAPGATRGSGRPQTLPYQAGAAPPVPVQTGKPQRVSSSGGVGAPPPK